MCFSFKTSVLAYSIGLISCILAFSTKQYVLGTLILFFCQIQLSEAMIWRGIDTDNIQLNKTGTLFGQYTLPSHNIGIGLGIILSIIFVSKKVPKFTDYIPIIIGILFYIYVVVFLYRGTYSQTTFPKNRCMDTRSCQNMKNRLVWPYPYSWYLFGFLISLVIMAIYIKPVKSKIFIGGMFILSLAISFYLYPKSTGTIWCLFSALVSILIVIGNMILIRNDKDILV